MEKPLSIKYYKPLSFPFIKAYIITMRPYLMFVSGVTGIAGISFTRSSDKLQLVLIFIASFLSYGFGQALTDCFQTDTDSISSPYRPLTRNIVSKKAFLFTSVTGLAFCVSVFSFYNPVTLPLGLLAGIGLATYTWFKRKWWGGPFYNAWIVMVLFFMSVLASGGSLLSNAVFPSAIAVLFGYANFVLSGYFKDIEADRTTGYNTLPVIYGRKVSAAVSDILAMVTIGGALSAILINMQNVSDILPSLAFLTGGILFLLYAQVRLHMVKTDQEAFRAISPVVHAYILLLSSIALSTRPGWLIYIIIFYLSYIIVLKIRPSKAQI